MFISRHGGEAEFVGLRTTDVCERFLKPSTCQEQKSYCPTFKNDPVLGKEISGATAFVSHAWGHEFLDVGMKLYRPEDGVFLERGGADSSYQAVNQSALAMVDTLP